MDPFLAIGLAANIVQFVDFAGKLVAGTRAIYHSASGMPSDAVALNDLATSIREMSDDLASATSASNPGPALRDLATDCKQIANELLQAITKLKAKHPHSKWESFMIALKAIGKDPHIKKLAAQLYNIQSTMGLQLLRMMRCVPLWISTEMHDEETNH